MAAGLDEILKKASGRVPQVPIQTCTARDCRNGSNIQIIRQDNPLRPCVQVHIQDAAKIVQGVDKEEAEAVSFWNK